MCCEPCALGWDSCSFDVFSVTLSRPLQEVYHLWTLAGGDMEGELKKRGLIKTKPPIMTLPMYVSCWFCSYKFNVFVVGKFDNNLQTM